MNDRTYSSSAQTRGYKVLMLLAGNEFNGLAPGEIAKSLQTNPSNITRDLRTLADAGLAEEIPGTGRWRLGPKVVQIALAFQEHLQRMQHHVNEMNQRYTRKPY